MAAALAIARSALATVRRLFTPVALVFLALAAWGASGTFAEVLARASLMPVLLATLAWALLNLLVPAIAQAWLQGMGASPGYRTLLRIHLDRLPARYLPGGIWHTVSRISDLGALGVDKHRLASLVLLETLAPLAMALLLAAPCVAAAGGPPRMVALLCAGGAALAVLLPLIRRRLFPQAPTPSLASHARAYSLLLVFWTVAALAFATYWSAFPTAHPEGGWAEVLAAYLLGWAAGFVAIFAPQGIGVFESVAGWLLKGNLPFAGIAVLVAGFRAATVAGDAAAYLFARTWRHARARTPRETH